MLTLFIFATHWAVHSWVILVFIICGDLSCRGCHELVSLLLIYFALVTNLATKFLYADFYQVQSDVPRGNVTLDNRNDFSLSDEQLQQLLIEGGFLGDVNPGQSQHFTHGNLPNQSSQQFTPASKKDFDRGRQVNLTYFNSIQLY